MRVETGWVIPSSEIARKPFIKQMRDQLLDTSVGHAAIQKMMPVVIDRGVALFEEADDVQVNINLLKEPLESGSKLVIVSNHQSQADMGLMVSVANRVRQTFPEHIEAFDFIVSETMGNGAQGEKLKLYYNYGIVPWMQSQDIAPIPVTSQSDIEKGRSARRSREGQEAALRALYAPANRAILMYPEGKMDGGKTNSETGKLNGIGEMDEGSIAYVSHMKKRGLNIVFLPLMVDGAYRIYSPDTKDFTELGQRLITSTLSLQFKQLIGVRERQESMVGSLSVGRPFTFADLQGDNVPHEIMSRIAQLAQEEIRGVHLAIFPLR